MEEVKWFENFWSDGTKGYEVVAGHTNAGINSVSSLLGFLMERYQAEDEYNRRILRLVASDTSRFETSPNFRLGISAHQKTILETASAHQQLVKRFAEQVIAPLQSWLEKTKKARKQWDADFERIRTSLQREFQQMDKLAKDYIAKFKEVQKAETKPVTKPKEVKELEKMKSDLENIEFEYKKAIGGYNILQETYDKTWVSICESAQVLERTRLDTMKTSLFIASKIQAQFFESQAKAFEQSIPQIQQLDSVSAINAFVDEHKLSDSPILKPYEFVPYEAAFEEKGGQVTSNDVRVPVARLAPLSPTSFALTRSNSFAASKSSLHLNKSAQNLAAPPVPLLPNQAANYVAENQAAPSPQTPRAALNLQGLQEVQARIANLPSPASQQQQQQQQITVPPPPSS